MTSYSNTITGCSYLGESVDEAEVSNKTASHLAEAVPTQFIGEHIEVWNRDADQLNSSLVHMIQAEQHSSERVKMMESLVKLQAVQTLREVLQSAPCVSVQERAITTLGELFKHKVAS